MDKLKRLIDANALPYENMVLCDDDWCLKVYEIERAPTIEAAPVHGEWVVDECDTSDDVPSSAWINFHCSECNLDYGLDEGQYGWCREEEIPYNYCPNCGAAMTEDNP